jgi:hypothetical protein
VSVFSAQCTRTSYSILILGDSVTSSVADFPRARSVPVLDQTLDRSNVQVFVQQDDAEPLVDIVVQEELPNWARKDGFAIQLADSK